MTFYDKCRFKKLYLSRGAICLFAYLFCIPCINAAPYEYVDGLSGTSNLITFDQKVFPDDTVITDQYASEGVRFSENITFGENLGALWGSDSLGNALLYRDASCCSSFSISFSTVVSEASLYMLTADGLTSISAIHSGQLVETFESFTGEDGVHIGFANILFDELLIMPGGGIPAGVNAVIDDVAFTVVPVPSSLLLLLSGLSLFWSRWRKCS